jgi:hypothetical protein
VSNPDDEQLSLFLEDLFKDLNLREKDEASVRSFLCDSESRPVENLLDELGAEDDA